MERISHIRRLNEVAKVGAYAVYIRQIKAYINRFHDIDRVSQELGVPIEILKDMLNGKRAIDFEQFKALMDVLNIRVIRENKFNYEVEDDK